MLAKRYMKAYGHKVLEEVPNLRTELQEPTNMTGLEKVSSSLLWEYNLSNFDWDDMRAIVVQRVCERGHLSDFYAILQCYGYNTICEIIKNEIKSFYNPIDLNFACYLFNIDVKETIAYNHTIKRHKVLNSKNKDKTIHNL
jgi:hypothetical protein